MMLLFSGFLIKMLQVIQGSAQGILKRGGLNPVSDFLVISSPHLGKPVAAMCCSCHMSRAQVEGMTLVPPKGILLDKPEELWPHFCEQCQGATLCKM